MAAEFTTISHFRELGGCKTADGRAIRHGLLYRSGELCHVSDDEHAVLESLGIDTVFDLRSAKDHANKPDRPGSYRVVCCPLAAPERECGERFRNPADYFDKIRTADEHLYNFRFHAFASDYLEFAYNRKTLSQIFAALDRHETLLVHCFGGKDRTGIVSMLIMAALGCDYESCKQNYMLHNEITREETAMYLDMLRKQGLTDWAEKIALLGFRAWEDLFDAAWYSVFDLYNSVEGYLEDQFGVTAEQIADWRSYYLE